MPTGKIKYYNQDKGYGFILQDEGEDLFFHILKSPSAGEIKVGQRVEYEITKGKKGLEAEALQVILTPFEQQKVRQGRVVVSKDTLVWTPDTDLRSKAKQPAKQLSALQKQSKTGSVPSKSVPREVKKPSPALREKDLSKEKAAPPKKTNVGTPPTEEEKKIKQEVKLQEPVSEKTQEEHTAEEEAPKKTEPNRRLTYGDLYILKQIRENTPMVFEMYNHESIFCTVAKLLKYDLDLLVDGGKKMQIQKHNIKYCYKQENAEKVKDSISFDEKVRSQGLTTIIPRKERYQIDHKLVKEAWAKNLEVRVVTRAGEIIMGPLDWFTRYEVKVRLPIGGNVIAFFHALYDFKVLSDKDVSTLEEPEMDSTNLEEAFTIPDLNEEVSLGEKIRAVRKALGTSQENLAESFGVSAQTIGNWERGKSQPQEKYHEQIEQLFTQAQSEEG